MEVGAAAVEFLRGYEQSETLRLPAGAPLRLSSAGDATAVTATAARCAPEKPGGRATEPPTGATRLRSAGRGHRRDLLVRKELLHDQRGGVCASLRPGLRDRHQRPPRRARRQRPLADGARPAPPTATSAPAGGTQAPSRHAPSLSCRIFEHLSCETRYRDASRFLQEPLAWGLLVVPVGLASSRRSSTTIGRTEIFSSGSRVVSSQP